MGQAKIEVRTLPCRMTEKEIMEAGMEAATKAKILKETLAEAKRVAANYKIDIDELKGGIARLQNDIVKKETLKEIDCQWFVNNVVKKKILRRLDNMDVVDSLPLREVDLQTDLFGETEALPEDQASFRIEEPAKIDQDPNEVPEEVEESNIEPVTEEKPKRKRK